jgi:hypothetical protein
MNVRMRLPKDTKDPERFVELDGQDITPYVRGIELFAHPRRSTRLVLELVPDRIEYEGDARTFTERAKKGSIRLAGPVSKTDTTDYAVYAKTRDAVDLEVDHLDG